MTKRLERRRATGRSAASAEYAWLMGTSGVTVYADPWSSSPPIVLAPHLPYGYCQLVTVELDVPDGTREEARRVERDHREDLRAALRGEPREDLDGQLLRQPERPPKTR